MDPLTYRAAGVDIDAGDEAVRRIVPLARTTSRPEVLGGIGAFAAFVKIPPKFREPVLVSSTDGVGSKLKIAFLADRHDTVDRKSTRLNSSHRTISYAVFCLKKKIRLRAILQTTAGNRCCAAKAHAPPPLHARNVPIHRRHSRPALRPWNRIPAPADRSQSPG